MPFITFDVWRLGSEPWSIVIMNRKVTITKFFVCLCLVAACAQSAIAATATKQGTGTDLTGATAGVWSGGSGANGLPTSADTATWVSTSLGAGLTLGSSASWGGISITAALTDIGITGAGTLTLGTGGINMSASANNLGVWFQLDPRRGRSGMERRKWQDAYA